MTVTYSVSPGQKPTAEQLKEVEEAAKLPITFDEDSPELTPDMEKAFRCAVAQRNRSMIKSEA